MPVSIFQIKVNLPNYLTALHVWALESLENRYPFALGNTAQLVNRRESSKYSPLDLTAVEELKNLPILTCTSFGQNFPRIAKRKATR